MIVSRIVLKNWKNFPEVDQKLGDRVFLVGPNASGKSNFLDALRFLHDIAKPVEEVFSRPLRTAGGSRKFVVWRPGNHLMSRSKSTWLIQAPVPRLGDTLWESNRKREADVDR